MKKILLLTLICLIIYYLSTQYVEHFSLSSLGPLELSTNPVDLLPNFGLTNNTKLYCPSNMILYNGQCYQNNDSINRYTIINDNTVDSSVPAINVSYCNK